MNILLVDPEMTFQACIPLGLTAVAAYVQRYGFAVDIFSCQGKNQSEIEAKFAEKAWDVVGFTGSISHYKNLKELAGTLRRVHPQTLIIMGGPLANAIPDFLVDNLDIDLAICGEGEIPFLQILQCCQSNTPYIEIAGGVYRDNLGRLVKNPKAHVISMDDLPLLPYDGFDIEPYTNHTLGRAINIQLSRGCPNSCSFCDNSLFPKSIRRRSRESLYRELQRIHTQYDFDYIYLDDLNPFVAPGLIQDFCEVIHELGYEVKWYGNGFTQVMNLEDLDVLVRGKCGGLHFGIESGSKDVLLAYNKHVDLARSKLILRSVIDKGIEVKVHWIIGSPNESLATIRESIEYFVSLGIVPAFKYLSPLPGTPMYDIAVSRGQIEGLEEYLLGWTDWYDDRPLCNISKFSDDDLVAIAHDAIAEIGSRVGAELPKWSGMWRGDCS